MKTYYQIDGDNNTFPTLRDAKWHCIIAYTPKERLRYLNDTCITKVVKDEVATYTPVRVSEGGKLSYGRTVKF